MSTENTNPGQSGDQGGGDGGNGNAVATPFDEIDLDLLDDAAAAKVTKAKADYIKAQTDSATLQSQLQQQKELTGRFQSEADKQRAELQQLKQPTKDPFLAKAEQFLAARGTPPEEIQKAAPFYADLFKESVLMAKEQIGADLGPLAGTVILHDAQTQFTAARASIPEIMDDEVSEEVWKFVQQAVQRGEQVPAAAIQNYAKMVYIDQGKHKQPVKTSAPSFVNPSIAQKMNRSTGNVGTGPRFSFPGASVVPLGQYPEGGDPSAGTPMNDDTRNALQAVFGRLGQGTGIFPKAFVPAKSSRPGHRSSI